MHPLGRILLIALGVYAPALIASSSGIDYKSTKPSKDKEAKLQTFGLCDSPQSADAFPLKPVPNEKDSCGGPMQLFSATSDGPSIGGQCGGYTVAFGQKGNLNPDFTKIYMSAYWGDAPLSGANCKTAKVAAIAWGERCTTNRCTAVKYEKIGGPKQAKGAWSEKGGVCSLSVAFASADKKYLSLNLDIIATVVENGKTVRKRAGGTISAVEPGHCISAGGKKPKRKQAGG